MCARCDELLDQNEALAAEVAYLRSELGLRLDADHEHRLKAAFPKGQVARGLCARMVLALYQAEGRTVTALQLLDAAPPRNPASDDERQHQLVTTVACHVRKALGPDAIENVWGVGYRLTETGIAKVRTILSPEQGAAA